MWMALGPLLSKINVTWTQALGHRDNGSHTPDGYQVTDVRGACTAGHTGPRGDSHPSRVDWDSGDFLTLLRMTHNLKLEWFISNYFHVMFLDCSWPWVIETTESKTADHRGPRLTGKPLYKSRAHILSSEYSWKMIKCHLATQCCVMAKSSRYSTRV